MSDPGDLKSEVAALLDKARRSLSAASKHAEDGDYDFASVRSYYAVYYAMTAALLTRQLTFSKHSGVITAFSEHFIKPGPFPKDFGAKIARLFRERQLGDYEAGLSVTAEAADEDISDAAAILSAITKELADKSIVDPS